MKFSKMLEKELTLPAREDMDKGLEEVQRRILFGRTKKRDRAINAEARVRKLLDIQ